MFLYIFLASIVLIIIKMWPLIFPSPAPLVDPPQGDKSTWPDYSDIKETWIDEKEAKRLIPFSKKGIGSKSDSMGGFSPSTIPKVFLNAVKHYGDKPALRVERPCPSPDGKKAPPSKPVHEWKTWTYKQYYDEVRKAAKGMIALGLEPYDAVNIFGFNAPEWHMGLMASIFAGGISAGIYPSDTPEQVKFKAHHSGASVAICEDMSKVERFRKGIEDLDKLKAIVVWAEQPEEKALIRRDGSECKLLHWNDLLDLGDKVDEEKLEERLASLNPARVCSLIYTSGTTGNPKAVMVSHDNILWTSFTVLSHNGIIGSDKEEERLISYLPLSHVAGMMIDIICPVFLTANGDRPAWFCAYFARPYDLKLATIVERFKAVRPTIFLGVPRVWEKIAEKLQAIGRKTKGLLKTISTAAKKVGLEHARNCQLGGSGAKPMGYGIAEKVVLNKIKEKLGLDKMKFGFTGAAPITTETLSYFGSLGIQVNEVYGMSECCGAVTWSTDQTHIWGSCGYALPGTEIKILKQNADQKYVECPRAEDIFQPTEEEQGEICFRGRSIMLGYMSNPELGEEHVEKIRKKNKEAIDDDGWLHSGDKGCMSGKGMVKITGRYKELIIGAGGENVAPVPIESNIKKLCPIISNIMMVGDKKKFNVALITLKAEGATGEKPGTDQLAGDAADLKAGVYTISEAMKDADFIKVITRAILDTNKDGKCCPSNAARIQRFTILPRDFSVETGELTPTLKLKRSVVQKMQADLIDKIYTVNLPREKKYVPYN
ncbi:hypothetical protein AAMO2058_001545300 [Amorphochlora amoebiformis]